MPAAGPNALADRPRSGRPRLGSRRLSARIRRLLAQPKAWTIGLLQAITDLPDGAVVLVLDNVLIHRSKLVQAWLRAHPRMRLLYGARYGPHHNPVERIWGALKVALANSPTLTIAGRIRQVHAFVRQRTNAQLLATAAPASSPWLPESYGQNCRQAA